VVGSIAEFAPSGEHRKPSLTYLSIADTPHAFGASSRIGSDYILLMRNNGWASTMHADAYKEAPWV
jgi:hypothetical protein